MHGAWRHNQAPAIIRREDGLDEQGEAPPPYQSKDEATVALSGITQDPASGLTIPLRTLSRESTEQMRPPDYQESNESSSTIRRS
jgi:hypothetical protein